MLGNGPVRFGGRPHGKGPAQRAPRRAAHPVPESRHHRLTALRYSLYQGRAEDASNKKGTVVEMIRTAITAAIVALFSFLLLPMLGAFGQKADADELAPGVTTLRFFEHDTQQTNLDLLRSGESPGDQSLFAGDLFDHAGGTQVGHTAGQCTALSGSAAGDILCIQTFVLNVITG